MKKTIKFIREYWKWLVLGLAIGMILSLFVVDTCACEPRCKKENAECAINESGKECCEGLVCVPFNEQSENGKCKPEVTPEPEPTPVKPTLTPVPEPTSTPVPVVPTEKPAEKREPAPAAPPEWSDPCFYLRDHEECKPKDEVFPGESEVFGPQK